MVNSVEREMIQSEWENWLIDENSRCDQVRLALEKPDTPDSSSASRSKKGKDKTSSQKVLQDQGDSKKREALKLWHEEYCGSCKQDQDSLLTEREGLRMS